MKINYLFFVLVNIILLSLSHAQNRGILHIRANGQQELVPVEANEGIKEVIDRLDAQKKIIKPRGTGYISGIEDTLSYFPEFLMDSQFRFDPFDVAFQWFGIGAELDVIGIWWRKGDQPGAVSESQIRVWRVDQRVFDLPNIAVNFTGHLGYYDIDCDSCDYSTTPYMEDSGSILKTMSNIDTSHLYFDPLGVEWLPGRTNVTLDSNEWQKVYFDIENNYDLYFNEMHPFGFTIQNTTPVSQKDSSLWIWATQLTGYDSTEHFSPYHSMKFYTYPFGEDSTIGWNIRNYEWSIYVIVDLYTEGSYVDYTFLVNENYLSADIENKISILIDDHNEFNPRFPEVNIEDAILNYKIGNAPYYQKVAMTISEDSLSATLPSLPLGKVIFMYVSANDDFGRRLHSQVESYNTVAKIDNHADLHTTYHLYHNYPNPFNPVTTISYHLSRSNDVEISVYNILGEKIVTLVSEKQIAGIHQIEWDASHYSSGLYYYRLQVDEYSRTRKMVLIK